MTIDDIVKDDITSEDFRRAEKGKKYAYPKYYRGLIFPGSHFSWSTERDRRREDKYIDKIFRRVDGNLTFFEKVTDKILYLYERFIVYLMSDD